jgi:hypothetical protein
LISVLFAENEIKESLEVLDKFLNQPEGITKDKYLALMEQLEKEPDLDKMPIDYFDLCPDAQIAINIYNRLGNRVYGDVGFVGKDYTNLPILIEIFKITNKDLLIDLLNVLDASNIDKSQKAMKKMMDDIKKKK